MTSLPECLFDKIEILLSWLLTLKASNRGGDQIIGKASDLLLLAQEMLSADVLLPNLVAIIENTNISQSSMDISMKVNSMETMQILIKGCQRLTEDV